MSTLDAHLHHHGAASGTVELIAQVYESATEPHRWPVWFQNLAASVDGRVSHLVIRGFGPTYYVTPEAPETGFATLNPTGVFETKSLTRRSFAIALVGNEIVEDWSRLHSRDEAGARIEVFSDGGHSLGAEDRSLLRELLPHLRRALDVHFELEASRQEQSTFRDCLHAFSMGILLLDREGAVRFANLAALDVLDGRRFGMVRENGVLRGTPSEVDAVLRKNLKEVTSGKGQSLRGQKLDDGVILWLGPLGRDGAVAFITSDHPDRSLAPELLIEAFELTPTQARVGSLLAAEYDVDAIAAELGISADTVRVHLKNIQHKTGARRQASLVRRVLERIPPIRDWDRG